ncbi:MAG: YncE family protein [Acidobacteriaceae bacterium]|nr:YncE family protein [Acidobacteriaceae bacterium]MBV9779799.1 YncE family protein [Acidobacteriaceae bacterium]
MTHVRTALPALLITSALFAAASYKLVKSIPIPGEGGWDYLTADSENRRLYVSHATQVDVVDLDSGKLLDKIPNTNGVHGIAVANDLHRGFVSDGRDNQVTIFDLKNLSVIATVKAGTNPDGIVYDPFSQRVFAFNGRSKDVTAIDAATGNVSGTLPLGGKPEFPVTDSQGNVYANIEDTSEIVHIDPKGLAIKNRWSLAPCDSPSGLAIDAKNQRLFSVCDNKIMAVSDAGSGKVITTVPIGEGPDAAGFDPETKLVFSSNGHDGTLTIVKQESPDKYSVVQTVKTQRGARTMAIDLKTHHVYLADAEFGPAPAATADNPHPRPKIQPGTFKLLVVSE